MTRILGATVVRAAVAWLGAVAVVLVGAPGASAAPGCWASSCSHYDPQTMGCSPDATSLITFSPEGSYDVQLRLSSACYAAWARVTNTATGEPRFKYLKLQVWDSKTGGRLLWTETRYIPQLVSGNSYWTAMGSFEHYVQACVKNANDWGHCSERR